MAEVSLFIGYAHVSFATWTLPCRLQELQLSKALERVYIWVLLRYLDMCQVLELHLILVTLWNYRAQWLTSTWQNKHVQWLILPNLMWVIAILQQCKEVWYRHDCANCYSQEFVQKATNWRIHFLLVLMIVHNIAFAKRKCILREWHLTDYKRICAQWFAVFKGVFWWYASTFLSFSFISKKDWYYTEYIYCLGDLERWP